MLNKKTIASFKNLIILECFLCINRSYLILDSGTKTLFNYFSFFIYILVFGSVSYDITYYYSEIHFNILSFLGLTALELLALSTLAQISRKKYNAVEKLDSKFLLDDDYIQTLKRKADLSAAATLIFMIIDICGMLHLNMRPGFMMLFCLGSAAHDCELTFISLFINMINIRLAKSFKAHPNFGCTVYRHVLIASSYFNEGFQFSILLICFVTFIKSVLYGFTIVLIYSEMTTLLAGYLLWRKIKSAYFLWVVCFAAYRTGIICKELGFHLASRLVLDSRVSNNSSSKTHQSLHRWYTSVMTKQPSFSGGQDLPIGLHVPLIILDVSINYLLLVIQFYTAYH